MRKAVLGCSGTHASARPRLARSRTSWPGRGCYCSRSRHSMLLVPFPSLIKHPCDFPISYYPAHTYNLNQSYQLTSLPLDYYPRTPMFPRRTFRPTPTSACPLRHTLIRPRTRSERARCDSPNLCCPTMRHPFTRPTWATLPSCPTSSLRPRPPRTTSKHTPFLTFRDQESTPPRSSQVQISM
jgi:hypothetical protein